MIYLIIYLIGFILTYTFAKYHRNKSDNNTLQDVILTFIVSLFSFLGLLILLIVYIWTIIEEDNIKPPKWL